MSIKKLEEQKEKFKARQTKWGNRGFVAFVVGLLSWYLSPEIIPIAFGCFAWSFLAIVWNELRIYMATELQKKEAENIEIK